MAATSIDVYGSSRVPAPSPPAVELVCIRIDVDQIEGTTLICVDHGFGGY